MLSKITITAIGSRKQVEFTELLDVIKIISVDSVLRSGAADGADSIFEENWICQAKEIYLPCDGFNLRFVEEESCCHILPETTLACALSIAKQIHPQWSRLKRGGRYLHARNIPQVLGRHLDAQSDMLVFCSVPDENGNVIGGTRTAVELARQYHIPTFNLLYEQDRQDAIKYYTSLVESKQ